MVLEGKLVESCNFKKCLLTGASGLLGSNLVKYFKRDSLLIPDSTSLDIRKACNVEDYFLKNQDIDLVIHCAAYTDVVKAHGDFINCAETNTIGTFNILRSCQSRNIKVVFISTDAVFNGEMGNYSTKDYIDPISKYAKSKAAAELLVRMYENSLIIRTSFFGETFPYEKAFIDQWTSKDYIDVMAPKIYRHSISSQLGIIHVHSERITLYNLALKRKPNVIKSTLEEVNFGFKLPKDLSLV